MSPTDTKPLVAVRGLTRRFGAGRRSGGGAGAVEALIDVNLDVHPGEFAAILGPSGSGKTTLFNIIGGLDRGDAGSVCVAGFRLDVLDEPGLAHFRGRTIGFVFQTFNLAPLLTARENVMLPMIFAGISRAEAARRASGLLKRVGLEDRADHRPSALSGGQQQRVAAARALANEAPLLLADEPTANLDPATGHDLLELLQDLRRERGLTVLAATHDAALLEVADRRFRLEAGRLCEEPTITRKETLRP